MNGQSVSNPTELAEEFNHHFATIGTKLASEIPESGSTSYHNYQTRKPELNGSNFTQQPKSSSFVSQYMRQIEGNPIRFI